MAVGARRIAACLHTCRYGLIYRVGNRCVMTIVARYDCNTLVVVCGFDFAICATLSFAIINRRSQGFSLALLVDGYAHDSFR